ncbi:MAG: hypothetical protein AAFX87_01625 [Bacteroidota bacterium]
MKTKLLTGVFIFTLIITQTAHCQEDDSRQFYLGGALKLFPHEQANTGVLIGGSISKELKNDQYRMSLSLLGNANQMRSEMGDGFEFERFLFTSFALQRDFVSWQSVSAYGGLALGFGAVKQLDGLGTDFTSEGWNGFFSLEPAVGLRLGLSDKFSVSAEASYLFNTESVEQVEFDNPIWTFGFHYLLSRP